MQPCLWWREELITMLQLDDRQPCTQCFALIHEMFEQVHSMLRHFLVCETLDVLLCMAFMTECWCLYISILDCPRMALFRWLVAFCDVSNAERNVAVGFTILSPTCLTGNANRVLSSGLNSHPNICGKDLPVITSSTGWNKSSHPGTILWRKSNIRDLVRVA